MDSFEYGKEMARRVKRFADSNIGYRKVFIFIVIGFGLFWLFGLRFLPSDNHKAPEPVDACFNRKVSRFQMEISDLSSNMYNIPLTKDDNGFQPYVGNGFIGVSLFSDSTIKIKTKNGRTLSAEIPFRPIVRLSVTDEQRRREAMITQYLQGVVQTVNCVEREDEESLETINRFYAHRTSPSIFIQDVTILNPSVTEALVEFDQLGWTGDPPFKSVSKRTHLQDGEVNYVIGSGSIEVEKELIAISIAYNKVPNALRVKAKTAITVRFPTIVNYRHLNSIAEFDSAITKLSSLSESELKRTLGTNIESLQAQHEKAWSQIWGTGFYISPSRANDALNGDKINATMYYVLSQVRDPVHEKNVPIVEVQEANAVLSYAEGCYEGHHTLQAPNLWKSRLTSESEILHVANLWLLTLKKNGCHNLLRAGATGVMQGMVLSFGALKFQNQHLEFNTQPKDLHRDYLFRRIWYGNGTHVNISVSVGTDNKAVIYVALDRSDKEYYACDAGCLDAPILLGPLKKTFPVKLTDPITSVLYITSDKIHVEELRLSIHVKEVFEAPAHETHVISLHKHGSSYGTMSTMFWILISLLIILFHLFLFHLVYTEYFGTQDKFRSRKVSDF